MVVMVLQCQVPACNYKPSDDVEEGLVATMSELLQLMQFHTDAVHPRQPDAVVAPAPATPRTEKILVPKLVTKNGSATEEAWDFFTHRWTQYKATVNLGTQEKEKLGEALGESLLSDIYGRMGHDKFMTLSVDGVLKEARHLVVKTRNKLVHRLKLNTMVQGGDESVTSFETRLKPVARTGKFQVKCTGCDILCDYTDEVVLDNLIRGLADEEIKKKVLATPEQDCKLTKVLSFVEAEESGKNSLSESKLFDSVAGISTFKRQQRDNGKVEDPPNNPRPHPVCGKVHGPGNCTIKCNRCGIMGHKGNKCRKFPQNKPNSDKDTKTGEEAHEIMVIGDKSPTKVRRKRERAAIRKISPPDTNWSGEQCPPAQFMMCGSSDLSLIKGAMVQGSRSTGAATEHRRTLNHLRFDSTTNQFIPTEKGRQNRVVADYVLDQVNYTILSDMLVASKLFEKMEQPPEARIMEKESIADTGATVVCGGTEILWEMGLQKRQLIPTNMTLFTADRKSLTVLGSIPVLISVKCKDGSISTTREMLYVVEELSATFLSVDALKGLNIIPRDFPRVQSNTSLGWVASVQGHNADTATEEPCLGEKQSKGRTASCGCPVREPPPEPPSLPCTATEENKEQLKQFLVDTYRASTFNTCQHQPLPMMHGPPMELFVDKNARPHQAFTPSAVPVHWKVKVKKDLDRDVALGVLEEVPENTPLTWCHRMVVCRKHNGDPRRTVDMQKLNEVSVRQCHPTQPPLQQAMDVPHNTKKSVLDAWNGYHSVALREEDRHYTTFCTMWGRYRYKSAPQGYAASGDAYTHRYDKITMGVKNIKRVIDDTLLHAKDLEGAFKQVADYLTLVGKNGIVLNSDKFTFGEDTVDWAGVRITRDKVQPLPEHIKAIREFPTPMNITDLRSYYALVNQVSHYYSVSGALQPFRDLLKKNTKWYWDTALQTLFEQSREHIANKVLEGIRLFDVNRWTAVCTDWSKIGVGFFMLQKWCPCLEITPNCCQGGWKVCMVGSSFNSPAEANYAPVEGECLGVASALHKTRYYTQGCDKLLVCTDHKPLLGILNDKRMEEMPPRLLRLKEKTLGWKFRIIHIPGVKLCGPDALSRAMAPQGDVQMIWNQPEVSNWSLPYPPSEEVNNLQVGHYNEVTMLEVMDEVSSAWEGVFGTVRMTMGAESTMPDPAMDVSGCMLASMELGVRSVSWDMVKSELVDDGEFRDLSDWISGGCVGPPDCLPGYIRQYWRVRDKLRLVERVPMLEDRTVIPVKLRKQVLQTLHSAHQGVLSMGLRAEQSVYWPGFWGEIEGTRANCSTCQKIAPSQANLPPVEPLIPNYPFEHVCVDYMSLNGHEFGVFVDRYTGWPGVYRGTKGYDVTKFLAKMCEDYGVPVSCTSDGGPNLTAKCVEDMMGAYGIHHRISSVGNPHANSRAELGVKTVKRMLRDNVGTDGSLDRAAISRALLQLRNTPDRDTKLSPAKALYGRELRDFLPRPGSALMGELWMNLADAREKALGQRSMMAEKQWSEHTRPLPTLRVGDSVMVQNQSGNHPLRWDRRGKVVKCEGYDQYQIMIDGSRRLTRRNRKYLRLFTPYVPVYSLPPMTDVKRASSPRQGDRQRLHVGLPGHVQQEHQHRQAPALPQPQQGTPQQPRQQHSRPQPQTEQRHQQPRQQQVHPQPQSVQQEHHEGLQAGQGRDEGLQAPAGQEDPSPAKQSPRRSSRAGRGETTKFNDFVTEFNDFVGSVEAPATYAQIVSGLRGRGHSW